MKSFTCKKNLLLVSIFISALFINGCGSGTNVKPVAEESPAQKVEKVAQEIVKQEEKAEKVTVAASKKEVVFEANLKQSKKVVHPPYGTKICSMCHKSSNPKDGNDLTMEQPSLCYQCHNENDIEGKKFIHGPVAAGACTICHNPHESENLTLLRYSNINELCTSCHNAKGEFLKNTENIHPPVKDSCINCHDPHTEDHKYQLRADRKKDICLTCHVDKQDWINSVKSKHGAINMGTGCQNCHDPHGTGQPKMMKAATVKDMCLKCHSQELVTDEEGYKLQNIGKHLDENPDWHGPIQWGDCAMCHNPHGSDNLRMLNKPFPKTFYTKFDEKNYICFECHDADKIKKAQTIEDTNFRNGNSNMHFLHVGKEKGRTCRACHDFHGTKDYPHHLKKMTQFGKISFPLRFIETPTGGSCAPACHARRGYDRENPVKNLK